MLLNSGGEGYERDDDVRDLARWSSAADYASSLHDPTQAAPGFSTILLLHRFSDCKVRNSLRDLSVPLRKLLRRILDRQCDQRPVVRYRNGRNIAQSSEAVWEYSETNVPNIQVGLWTAALAFHFDSLIESADWFRQGDIGGAGV